MNVTFTVRKLDPVNRFVGLTFSRPGKPDYYKNYNTDDFTRAGIEAEATRLSGHARAFWDSMEEAPVPEISEGFAKAVVAPKYVYEDQPQYDPMTEKLEEQSTYDELTATTTISYNVVPMTEEEMVAAQIAADKSAKAQAAISGESVQLLTKKLLDTSTLTDDEKKMLEGSWPEFAVGKAYAVDDVVFYKNMSWRCIQAHTSQADWRPDVAASLWTAYRAPDQVTAWVQPTGAHDAYALGATVTHNGSTWTSDVDANVWEPGVSQWTEVV